jgi:hypothetical protein
MFTHLETFSKGQTIAGLKVENSNLVEQILNSKPTQPPLEDSKLPIIATGHEQRLQALQSQVKLDWKGSCGRHD